MDCAGLAIDPSRGPAQRMSSTGFEDYVDFDWFQLEDRVLKAAVAHPQLPIDELRVEGRKAVHEISGSRGPLLAHGLRESLPENDDLRWPHREGELISSI